MLKPHLCDYNDAYALVKKAVTVAGAAADKMKNIYLKTVHNLLIAYTK